MKADSEEIDKKLAEAGYKNLGWQNGWKHIYLDKDKNPTTDKSKAVYFSYAEEDCPEWFNCQIKEKHKVDEICHNNKGSENTVNCDICKIYWKYDSSD
jgi:hypothetical protein